MGEHSKIQWTDHTFNHVIGCQRVAPGCQKCYAESFAKRTGMAQWGPQGTRVKTSEANWRKPLKWNREAEKAGVRKRVFTASLADVFESWEGPIVDSSGQRLTRTAGGDIVRSGFTPAPGAMTFGADMESSFSWVHMDDVRRDLFALIDRTPWLDWLVLTKRPENARRMWPEKCDSKCECDCHEVAEDRRSKPCAAGGCWERPNVWLGTSISDQATADRNVPLLLESRGLAPVLFLSAEPLLGPVDFGGLWYGDCAKGPCSHTTGRSWKEGDRYEASPMVDWAIVGCESGHGRRPMNPDWARSIRDQCQAAGVAFFMKQMEVNGKVTGELEDFPADLRVREFPMLEAAR